MATNTYKSVPVPVGNGIGAPVSVIGLGFKTFVIGGVFDATIFIEGGINGKYAPLLWLDKPQQFRDIPCVFEDIRVRIVNYKSGSPVIFVGGNPVANTFGTLDVPASDGVGIPLDTSLFGSQKTIVADGIFDSRLTFEVSEDIGGPFAPIQRLDKTNNLINQTILARFVRVRVDKYVSGLAAVSIGGADLISAFDPGEPTSVRGSINAQGGSDEVADALHRHRLELQVEEGAVFRGARPTVDFVGAGVGVVDDALNDKSVVTIPGGLSADGAVVKRWLYKDNTISTSGGWQDAMSGDKITIPISGTYFVDFEGEGENQSASGVLEIAASINSVVIPVANTIRESEGSASDIHNTGTSGGLGFLLAGDFVHLLFRKRQGGGNVRLHRRNLTVTKTQ